ncbi:MAG TPA: GFA family protein [Noviherbaspirillum sp.]
MSAFEVSCLCGACALRIDGEPISQFYCHCDDCQAVQGAAYIGVALYPSSAVAVTRGTPVAWTYKTMPRYRCADCGTHLFGRFEEMGLTGIKGNLLPRGVFRPAFHIQCQYAVLPVVDSLPHYKGFPAVFGGADDLVGW